uniref:histidine kinase n=1 Tax=Solibacter usitatus (strain Ellin6076) TaxID=234267 RepID=Q01RQ0_SOLUE
MSINEEMYRRIVEAVPEGIWVVGGEGRTIFSNRRMAEILGVEYESMSEQTCFGCVFPDELADAERHFARTFGGDSRPFDFRLRRGDGSPVWVSISCMPVHDDKGTQVGLLGLFSDITERKQAEAALRESEERFRNMADTAPVMIWVSDENKQLTFFNKTWLKFTGRTMEQELGEGWAAGVHPEDIQNCYETFCSAFDAHRNFQIELRLRRADGEYRSMLCSGVPRFAPGGVFAGYIGCDIDITDLQSEERFRELAENINQVFWMLDLDTSRVLYISPSFEKVWGCSAAAYQDHDWLVETVHAEDRGRFILFRESAKAEAVEETYRIVRPDGTIRWIHDRAFLVRDSEGKPYRVAGIAEDVTAHRELEEELRQAHKMEAIGRLAGGVAHDFNNLLTVIGGYARMLFDGANAQDPTRAKLEQILTASDRASVLTMQLLAISRRHAIQPKLVNVNNLLTSMASLLRRIIGEHITIETALDPELSCIKVDPHQIEQVVMNLAANARDAMPNAGKFRIETSMALAPDKPGEDSGRSAAKCVRLRIGDTGCGMDDRTRQRAFEPFFTTKGVGRGTGLGLSMVYGFVHQNQGTIHVSSEPGQGTIFDLCFPAQPEREAEPETPVNRLSKTDATETVLVAEDEPAVRELVRQTLEQRGYTVLEAKDGYEALRVFEQRKNEIHLLLTDVIMPLMNGRELAKRLESLRPGMKIVYMSGYTDEVLAFHGFAQPEIEFIQKPFTASELANKVELVLSVDRRAT